MKTKEKEEAVSIDKITLKIGPIKVSVTMEQAKKLHSALSEMFGIKETIKHEHHYDNWYWPWNKHTYYYNPGPLYGAANEINAGGLAANKLFLNAAVENKAQPTLNLNAARLSDSNSLKDSRETENYVLMID